jgi:hypothetical protein
MRIIICLLLLAMALVPACTRPIDVGPGLDDYCDQFSKAMRWKDFIGAGNFVRQDVRSAFLDQFQEDEDLNVVDSRIVNFNLNIDQQTAEADYLLEYFRLPSMQVKKWKWKQQWELHQPKALKTAIWHIVNAPPPVP